MLIAAMEWTVPSDSIKHLYESDAAFEDVLVRLCQTIACDHSGYVCRDVSGLELAIIVIEISELEELKKDSIGVGHAKKALNAMIRYIESNNKKGAQAFMMVGS